MLIDGLMLGLATKGNSANDVIKARPIFTWTGMFRFPRIGARKNTPETRVSTSKNVNKCLPSGCNMSIPHRSSLEVIW